MLTALVNRPVEQVFASNAHVGELIAFPNVPRGWGLTFDSPDNGGNGGFPPVEWVNGLWNELYNAAQYFLQRGVAEWATTTLYAPGSLVSQGERIYRARRAHSGVTPGTDPNTWALLADAADSVQLAPPGMVGLFANPIAPAGWLKMNGAALPRASYQALFAAIGTTYGAPDGNTFNLPDARGEFLRAWDDGRGVDSGRGFGTWQGEDMHPHWHTGTALAVGDHWHAATAWTDGQGFHGHAVIDYGHYHLTGGIVTNQPGTDLHGGGLTNRDTLVIDAIRPAMTGIGIAGDGLHAHNVGVSIGAAGAHAHSVVTDWQGITETRPRNIAWLACIKY
ncbi:phage tail protein [Paraburkholderia sp. BR10923]|uniref:phage tail protein n=1 Tax=Paraburkholderia sp. BR10923 TaxID=3236992 RepID=UPI0034CF9E2A